MSSNWEPSLTTFSIGACMIVCFILRGCNFSFIAIKIDRYLVNVKDLIWPTIFYNVDPGGSHQVENVKDSKPLFRGGWSLFKDGTNHPSIAHRGVSCSKVEVGEPVSSHEIELFVCVLKTQKGPRPVVFNFKGVALSFFCIRLNYLLILYILI